MRDNPSTGRRTPRTTATARTTTAATRRAVAGQKKYAKPTAVTEAGVGWYAAAKAGQAAVKALTKKAPAQASRGVGKAVAKGGTKTKGPTQAQVKALRQGRLEDAALRADLHTSLKRSLGGQTSGTTGKAIRSTRPTPAEKVRGTSGHKPRTTKGTQAGKANVVKTVGRKQKPPKTGFLQDVVDDMKRTSPKNAATLRKQYNVPATRTTSVGAGRLTKGQKAAGSRYTAQARKGM